MSEVSIFQCLWLTLRYSVSLLTRYLCWCCWLLLIQTKNSSFHLSIFLYENSSHVVYWLELFLFREGVWKVHDFCPLPFLWFLNRIDFFNLFYVFLLVLFLLRSSLRNIFLLALHWQNFSTLANSKVKHFRIS